MMWYITISQLDIAVVLMCGIFSILPLYMAAVLMVWYIYCFTIRYGSCTDGMVYEFTITYGSCTDGVVYDFTIR